MATRAAFCTGLLCVSVLAATLGACGNPPETPTPAAPTAATAPAPTATPTSAETPPAPTATTSAPAEAPPAPNKSTHLQPSAYLQQIAALGVDLTKSPSLAKLPMAQKKKLMPILQKALGYTSCNGCHVEGDYQADTRNKKVASAMWDHFVAPLRDEKGGPIFCDSCHAGKEDVLDRTDKKALSKFMADEYEKKLTRADGTANSCVSCHGDYMTMEIIEELWHIPK